METLTDFLQTYFLYWLLAYSLLAGLYLLVGTIAVWVNRHWLNDNRIQVDKTCPPKLIRRDIRQSLKSLLNISGMLAAGLACRDAGFALTPDTLTWSSALLWIAVSMLLFDTWFYWAHRLIHHPKLYRKVHSWHHKSVTPTVWANNSDTFVDNLFCQSYWFFAPLLLPAPTIILCGHKIYDQITGMLGHAGYEYAAGALSAKPSPMIGTSFHDQHHSAFHYNFATHFSFWDRLMGTIHPDYDKLVTSFKHNRH